LSRNDLDVVTFDYDALFIIADQVADGPRLPPQTLDRIGDVFRLVDECVAQVGGPIHIRGHHLKNVWIVDNSLDGLIPVLFVNRGHISAAVKPCRRIGNLCRICRRRQHLGQKRVRIERYGGEKIVKFLVREG
jgi:hypothetical protein